MNVLKCLSKARTLMVVEVLNEVIGNCRDLDRKRKLMDLRGVFESSLKFWDRETRR